ncbi:MAG: hypothetical protein IPN84_02415 [Sphingomonadales bacterium]|jgi:hypothetical protein|nr:hypothetical protein [Sphingomonadales bacterium]
MSGWRGRILAVFSMLWGLIVLGALALAWLARDYMLSPETGWQSALLESGAILGLGWAVWFGVFRLMRWFEERS